MLIKKCPDPIRCSIQPLEDAFLLDHFDGVAANDRIHFAFKPRTAFLFRYLLRFRLRDCLHIHTPPRDDGVNGISFSSIT